MAHKSTFFRTLALLGFVVFFLAGCTTTLNVTVTFDTNGGNIIEPIETSGATSINIPDNPIKDGFVFDGWFWDNQTFQRPFTANSLLNEPITNNITVYAKWISEDLVNSPFTIVFDVQGGSVISSQTVLFRQFASKPNDPTRLGYLFGGWYKDTNYNTEWNFTTDKIESNVTLYAKWNLLTEDYHIIHFVTNFETTVPSQQVLKGSGLVAPTVNRIGYTLEGWYTSLNNGETLDEKWAFTTNTVNSNFTLYAKWNINRYTIAFNTNGGTSVQSITENYNTVVNAPTNPTRSGYVFGGWYQDVELTTPYTFTSMQASNITIYASWLRTITFVTNSSQNINNVQYKPQENIILPSNLIKEGHTFDGWYSNQGLTTPFDSSTMPDNNLTLYAKWVVNQYTISFNIDGGTDKLDMVINFGENINIANNSEKTGHTFAGWFIDENITNAFNLSKMPAYDFTLYAKWNINQYNISYNTNGGSIISSTKVTYNETITLPNEPTKVGHTFDGWYIDNTLLTPYNYTNMPAQNITLYVKWRINTTSIRFFSNGGSVVESITQEYGTRVNEPSEPVNEGHKFDGWYTDLYFDEAYQFTTMPDDNIILYAKWKINKYTISFNSNGGVFIEDLTQDYGTIVLEPPKPTRENFVFIGWYSDLDFTTLHSFTTMLSRNITIHAKWVKMNEYFTINNTTYIFYGKYPQTVVSDNSLITSLNQLTKTNIRGYYDYQGYEYKKIIATPINSNHKFNNGDFIISNLTYYFIVEPIKWRVLEQKDSAITLLSEYIIDKQVYNNDLGTRAVQGVIVYANNYKHSPIRYWLNNDFYNKAFSSSEKGLVLTSIVDNSAKTTNPSSNAYGTDNTEDKVFLLSYSETASSSEYGFVAESLRISYTTDYVRALGIRMSISSNDYGNGFWWLRSPYGGNNHFKDIITANFVSIDGRFTNYTIYVDYKYMGVRPVIKTINTYVE